MPDLTITVAGTGSGSRPDEVATVGNLPAATGARPGTTLRTIRTHREAARVFAAQPSPRVIGGALLVALARRALDRRTGNGSGPSVPTPMSPFGVRGVFILLPVIRRQRAG